MAAFYCRFMSPENKIVFNTAILYGRMLVTIGISLYATRLILNNLGANDYGLYNVVGGIVAMLSFLNAAMTISTQRYLSFNMGTGDRIKIKRVLGNSMLIHIVLGLLLVIIFESLGTYFIETKLNIEPERIYAAKMIFHFTVISGFVSIASVPYDAVVNAHENMVFVASVNILESVFKLAVAVLLTYVWQDKLVVYGLLTMAVTILVCTIKQVYCYKRYSECSVNILKVYDLNLIREMSSFAGWNLFGVICGLSRSQGIAVLLNLFFSTIVNAAYSIANQVNSQMSFLSMTMMKTVRPQMMKSEGAGDRQRMLRLSVFAGKFSFYLNAIVSIPMFIAMPQVLAFWLGQVPEYTVVFCRYMLILNLAQQFSMGIMAATQAVGNIKRYQLVVGSIQILTLPISYFALKAGYSAVSVMVSMVSLELVANYFRIYYFHAMTAFPVPVFLKEVVLTPLVPSTIVFLIAHGIYEYMELNSSIWHLAPFFAVIILLYLLFIYLIGISVQERRMIHSLTKTAFGKLIKVRD